MTAPETMIWGLKLYEFFTLVAIVLGPILAVGLTLIFENRRKTREQQTQTMRLLIGTRHLPSDPGYTAAINMIPVDFNDNRKVMAAWSAYIECIRYKAPEGGEEEHFRQVTAKQTKLIFQVMKSLGYSLAETDIQTTAYAADGFIRRELLMLDAWAAWPRIAAALEAQSGPDGEDG